MLSRDERDTLSGILSDYRMADKPGTAMGEAINAIESLLADREQIAAAPDVVEAMRRGATMSQELKPCPFCGSQARWAAVEGGDSSWEIQCSNDDCCIVLFAGATGEETARAWNTRAERPTDD